MRVEGVAALDRRAPAAGAPGHRGRRRRVPAGAPRDRRRAGDDSHCLRCHLSGLLDPTTDNLCRDVLRRIGREGRNRCRGQVTGVGWAQAEAAAARAADSGNLQGFRDAAIILVMSDTLARISEVVALQCSDVEPETTTSGGTVHIRASKTDQLGGRRYALHRAGHARRDHAAGPLFRRVLRGGHGSSEPLGADGIRGIVRKRVAAVPGSGGRVGGHSFRVGRAAAGRAGGARLDTPEVYIRLKAARGPVARGAATGWAGSNTLYRAGLPAIGSGKVPTRMYRSPLPG